MLKLLDTDFLKNKNMQQIFGVGLCFELFFFHSLIHSLVLFGLPYLTSVILKLLFQHSSRIKTKALISKQFRARVYKIRIIPR